jgi:hypothetical protein
MPLKRSDAVTEPAGGPPGLRWREEWLSELAKCVHPIFKGFAMAPYRLTCGWPCRNGLGRRRRTVGECHARESSKEGVHEIFISPVLDEPLEVAGTVCHELAHVAAGIKAGHGKGFVTGARHSGLTRNRPTSAMPSSILESRLRKMLESLGPYPHSAVLPALRMRPAKPRTSVKLTCPSCQCVVTIGISNLKSAGLPTCGCGTLFTGGLDADEASCADK